LFEVYNKKSKKIEKNVKVLKTAAKGAVVLLTALVILTALAVFLLRTFIGPPWLTRETCIHESPAPVPTGTTSGPQECIRRKVRVIWSSG
jgi:hypothetical protein